MTVRALTAALLVACGTPAKPPVKPLPPPAPVVVAPKPGSIWPVPMRVMTWTPGGLVQMGILPDAPPISFDAQSPATPWYVEPTRPLDDKTFAAVVDAVRKEHVPGLSLRAQPITPAWLTQLRDLPELTALVLDDTTVDATGVRSMQLALRRLYLARTRVDDAAVAHVAAEHRELEVIDIEDCVVSDAGIAAIATLPALRAVNASGTRVTDAGAAALGKVLSIEVVDLGRTRAGVKTVEALAQRALHQLVLDKTHAGRAITKLASIAPRLERIDVSSLVGYRPTDADVAWLANAPNLVEVGLSQSRVTDKLVTAIAALPALAEIRLAGTAVTTKSIEKLVRSDLREIDLAETAVTDANAAALIKLPSLRVLRLDKTAITDAALAPPGPSLVELYLSQTKVTDAGLAILDGTPNLEALGLGRTHVSDATIARIAKLTALHTLVLSGTRADDESLVQLGKLTALERLYVDDTLATSSLLLALHGRPLRVLHLAETQVADDALAALASLTQLQELTIGDTRMTPTAVATVVGALPRIRVLTLVGLQLADAQLPALAKATRIERLDLSATEVTDPTALGALPNLVELGLSQTKLTTQGKTAANALAKRGVKVVR